MIRTSIHRRTCHLVHRSAKSLNTPNGQSGLTLIEVMIAAVVLLFVFVSTLAALQTGYRLMETARNTTLANQILQSEIEDIRLYNWAKIEKLVSAPLILPVELQAQFEGSKREIEDVAGRTNSKGDPNMRRLKITVTWKSYAGNAHIRTYETLFTQQGINDYIVPNRTIYE